MGRRNWEMMLMAKKVTIPDTFPCAYSCIKRRPSLPAQGSFLRIFPRVTSVSQILNQPQCDSLAKSLPWIRMMRMATAYTSLMCLCQARTVAQMQSTTISIKVLCTLTTVICIRAPLGQVHSRTLHLQEESRGKKQESHR